MRYNVRVKTFPSGDFSFMFSSHVQDTCKRAPRQLTGQHIERGEVTNLKTTIQEVYNIAKSNSFDWFLTLTFDPNVVDSYSYIDVSAAMGRFTDILRKRGCKYIFVPELHETCRYHFHGLLQGDIPMTKAVNPYTGENLLDEKGRQVYNIDIYKYGFTQATQIDDCRRAASYLTKYLSKDLGVAVPKGKKRYWASRSLARPDIDYELLDQDQFGSLFTGADYRKEIHSRFGHYYFCEYHTREEVRAEAEE